MSDNAKFSLFNCEAASFAWMQGVLTGITGYLGELPKNVATNNALQTWVWEINGGGDWMQIKAAQRPGKSWRMNARFMGRFTERSTAQLVCGTLLNALPVDIGEVTGVSRITPTANPTITRAVLPLAPDQDTGGDVRVWLVEWNFDVIFGNEITTAQEGIGIGVWIIGSNFVIG